MPDMLVAIYISVCAGMVLGWFRLPIMLLVALPLTAGLAVHLHSIDGIGSLRALGDFALLFAAAQIVWGLTYVLIRRRLLRRVR